MPRDSAPTLVDHTGLVTQGAPDEDPNDLMAELGSTGLSQYGGYIAEEPLAQLQGAQGIKTLREMSLNDATVASILYAIDMMVRQVEWATEPGEDTPVGREAAQFLQECMFDMSVSWEDFISEVLSMLVYGFSIFEIDYKRRIGPDEEDSVRRSRYTDGRIGWRKFAVRSQDTLSEWIYTRQNPSLKGIVQMAPPDFIATPIPIEKLLLFRTVSFKNNPEGRSVLRGAYRSWFFKRRIEEIEGIGIERDLAGLPVVFAPSEILRADAPADKKELLAKLKALVRNVRRDQQEGVVFPRDYDDNGNPLLDFTLMSAGGSREFDTSAIIERYDQRIAMTVLADFILLGHDAVGSFALSSDKTNLFGIALGTVLKNIASVINRYAVPRLFAVNGVTGEFPLPVVKPGDVEKPDLVAIASVLDGMTKAGMDLSGDADLEAYVRTQAGFPLREAENG